MTGKSKMKRGLGRGLGALISAKPVSVIGGNAAISEAGGAAVDGAGQMNVPPRESAEKKIVKMPGFESAKEGGSADDAADALVRFVSIATVVPNPDQPRKYFEESEVEELVASIKNHGVLQPILVRPGRDGELQIVAGERRWRAASRAKLAQIPVIIRDMDDLECLEISLVENVQRSNLSPLEEATGYQELISRFQLTQGEVAAKVGKDRASVANMVRLLKLPEEVQQLIEQKKISVGHAKAILTVREPKLQKTLALKVVKEGLSVREIERIVARKVTLKGGQGPVKKGGKIPAKFRDLTEELQKVLGSKVAIQDSGKGRGKIQIDYSSAEELERIAEAICFRD